MTNCVDCGKETTGGVRCKPCHGAFMRRTALEETADRDRSILAMADGEKLSGDRLAARLGVSRTSAAKGLRVARVREEKRRKLGIGAAP